MDNSAQWPQGFGGGGVVKGVDNPSSSGSIDQQQQQQKRTLARPQKDQIVNCPRCNSVNTKFCYYNNYSLSQPRYFCKTCRRYWTAGGSLRNVPVGGGSRKNRRSSSISSSSVATNTSSSVHSQASAVANNLHQGHDLNLSFPLHPTTTTTHDQYPNPTFTTTSTKPNFSMDNHLSNTTTKLLPHHLQNPNSTNMTPLLPPMGLFKNTILAAHDPHSSREMMSSLMNKYPLEHHQHTSNSSNASIFSNPGFTQIHQGQFKPSSLNFSLDGFSNDNHNEGYAASCLQLGVQQQSSDHDDNVGGMRLLFPFNQQENMNNKDQHQKQVVPSASVAAGGASISDNVVRQFDHQHNMIINRSSSSAAASVDQGGNGGEHNNGSSAGFWTGMLSGGSW